MRKHNILWIALGAVSLLFIASSLSLWFVPPGPPVVYAQNTGQSGSTSTSKSFALQTTAGVLTVNNPTNPSFPTLLPNIGQGAHYVFFCAVNVTALEMVIEGSFDNVSWIPISPVTTEKALIASSSCAAGNAGLLQGGGYYPDVRVRVANIAGSSPQLRAWYSGIAGPIAVYPPALQDGNGALVGGVGVSPTVCSRGGFFTVADNSTQVLAGSTTATYACVMAITFGGNTTASGTIEIFTATNIACNAGIVGLAEVFAGPGRPIVMGSNLGSLFQVFPGQFLCATTTGVGTNTMISFSLSQY